ncbi:MAG: prepilin-type N-terminal cleavage/methylation domain-containing protein [Nitrospirota bacterium]|jgi:prepilin-type N-terminal cleavage/methylation domain-containing protein
MLRTLDNASSQAGFSLIELMVGLTLSLVVVGGSLATYKVQQNAFERQGAMGEVEQNIRFALDMIADDVRQTGYLTNLDINRVVLTPINDNAVGGDGIVDGQDAVTVRYAVGDAPASLITAIPTVVQVSTLDLDGDGVDDLDTASIDPLDGTTWIPAILSNGYSNSEAETARVSGVVDLGGGNYQVTLTKVTDDVGNDGALDGTNYAGAILHLALLYEVDYYITDGAAVPNEAAPVQPQLVRRQNGATPDVIADGVTSLRLRYSISGSSTLDADLLDDVSADNLAAGAVTAVRVDVGGRATTPDRHGNFYEVTYTALAGVRNALTL